MSGRSQPVLIAGAGVCGLSAALALAARGMTVRVLERRLDPDSPAGRAALAHAATAHAQATRMLAAGSDARALFRRSAGARAAVWGTRRRNVLIDSWALGYLARLGVNPGVLPAIARMSIDWGPGAPCVTAHYAGPVDYPASAILGATDLVFRRDWAAQPTLAVLERALRTACDATDRISIAFGCDITGIDTDARGVYVSAQCEGDSDGDSAGDGRGQRGAALVIADGGGQHSVAHLCGVTRETVFREALQIAVFASTREDIGAVGHGGLVDGGWAGIADNGDIATVQYAVPGAGDRAAAYQWGRDNGLTGAVLEYAVDIDSRIDHATDLFPAPGVLLAGDAAARGSPLFGLGAQYGILWAELIAERLAAPRPAVAVNNAAARDATTLRRTFEADCMRALEQLVSRCGRPTDRPADRPADRLAGWLTAADAVACLDDLRVNLLPAARGARLDLDLVLDWSRLRTRSELPGGAISGLGRCRLEARLELDFVACGFRATLGERHRLIFTSALESISVIDGMLSWLRNDAGDWCVQVEDAVIRRTHGNSGAVTERAYRRFEIALPAALCSAVLDRVAARLVAADVVLPLVIRSRFTLRAGATMTFGPCGIQAARTSTFSSCFEGRGADGARWVIDLGDGRIRPFGLLRAPLAALTPTRALTDAGDGIGAALADAGARLAARTLKRIVLTFDERGGSVRYVGTTSVTLPLSPGDVAALTRMLLDTALRGHAPFAWRREVRALRVGARAQ